MADDQRSGRMRYENPPVHEVILDLQFHTPVDSAALRRLRTVLTPRFERIDEQMTQSVSMSFGPLAGGPKMSPVVFAGFLCSSASRDWVLRVAPSQVTMHTVRPGKWPSGQYIGWEATFERFLDMGALLEEIYSRNSLRRVGLRYINKIAVPKRSDLSALFAIPLTPPTLLEGLFSFDLKHTWEKAGGFDDIAATIGWAKIDVQDADLAPTHDGILLDIDVFNLRVASAPEFTALEDWYERAHAVENQIFENSITNEFREMLHNTHGARS